MPPTPFPVDEASARCGEVLDAVESAVIVRREFLETMLVGALSRGHVLLEDVPGTGKTLTAHSLATALGLSFSRIQFTPDLLPSDITGTNVFDEANREFEFHRGPVFANVVLADEINRAPPKTQAALLEAMAEGQVTVEGETRTLPEPFFVIATQNPVESEGSLHPEETVLMNGRLWTAKEALEYARENGQLVHDGQTRLYEIDATTQTLRPEGTMATQSCLVYETDYSGQMVTVKTKTGRSIRVSGNHPFLVNRDGIVQWIQAENLLETDSLVTPKKLTTTSEPFPGHDAALSELADEFEIVEPRRIEDLLHRHHADERLTRDEIDHLRIVCGLSKRELAEKAGVSYDRALNYLDGAETAIGDALRKAIPEEIQYEGGTFVESHETHRFTSELSAEEAGFFVGYVLSDGHYTPTSIRIYQKNHPESFDQWVRFARKLGFDPRIRETESGREAAIDSKPLVEYLKFRYDLEDPAALLSAPEAFREAFLDVFLLTESHFDRDRQRVTFTQKDRTLTNLVAHLLLQFGIRPWIRDDGRVYRIRIQGEDIGRFVEQFSWPGEPPEKTSYDSSHRTVPVDHRMVQGTISALGIDRLGDLSERDWYNSVSSLSESKVRIQESKLQSFVDDVTGELVQRRHTNNSSYITANLASAARESGLAITDLVDQTSHTKHAVWNAYEGHEAPEEIVRLVQETRKENVQKAETLSSYLGQLIGGDTFHDPVKKIDKSPYDGSVIGLSVPETHNYVAGMGACGINHNTFPLPEAQVDRFAVKTAMGYPDLDGEVELLRRRAGRTEQVPSVEEVIDGSDVAALQQTPETVHTEEDLLTYVAELARTTRDDRRVRVGVSPRGTQRLFEVARAHAVLRGREFLTPDDVKAVARPVLSHRLVLTPEAQVDDVEKETVVDDALDAVSVPTVERR